MGHIVLAQIMAEDWRWERWIFPIIVISLVPLVICQLSIATILIAQHIGWHAVAKFLYINLLSPVGPLLGLWMLGIGAAGAIAFGILLIVKLR